MNLSRIYYWMHKWVNYNYYLSTFQTDITKYTSIRIGYINTVEYDKHTQNLLWIHSLSLDIQNWVPRIHEYTPTQWVEPCMTRPPTGTLSHWRATFYNYFYCVSGNVQPVCSYCVITNKLLFEDDQHNMDEFVTVYSLLKHELPNMWPILTRPTTI